MNSCVVLDGPCQIDVQRPAGGGSHAGVQCEAGGSASIVAPGAVLDAAGRAAAEVRAASAPP